VRITIIVDDKTALVTSNAGMRLIALQTLVNRGDFDRVRAYFNDYATAAALESQPVDDRVESLRMLLEQVGKLRVTQVLAVDKHRVVALFEAQNRDILLMHELAVEEDYPDKITAYTYQPLDPSES
jgi:hypothetical protein